MGLGNIIDAIKDKFLFLKEKAIDFYNQNKKIAIICLCIIILLLILIIIIIANSGKSKKKEEPQTLQLIVTENLQIPAGPEISEEYNPSRITGSKWEKNETEEWFTIPSDKEINNLSSTNKNIVNEIIKAAP